MTTNSKKIALKDATAITALDIHEGVQLIAIGQQADTKGKVILSLFNADSLELVSIVETYNNNYIPAVAFSRDGKILFYSRDDDMVLLFDTVKLKGMDYFIDNEKNRKIISSTFDDKIIVSGIDLEVWNIDQREKLWDLDNYKAYEICDTFDLSLGNVSWDFKEYPVTIPYIKEPLSACFFNKGQSILYCGDNKPSITRVNMQTFVEETFINDGVIQSFNMKVDPSEDFLMVSGQIPNGDFIWDTQKKKRVLVNLYNEKFGHSPSFDFHPSKRILAVGSTVGYLSLVDMDNGNFLLSEKIHQGSISQLKFYQGGSKIISGSIDGQVLVTEVSAFV